ncbi:MAG TPA: YCF48-related protein [Prolixibacteraceae bacterium]|nr:YCF48-related protein [Prolixibacteraceae bacterium]
MLKFYLLLTTCILFVNAHAQDWKWVNPSPTGHPLNGVKMVDATTAYAVGNHGTILKSTNGGRDWNIQHSNTVSNLSSISAIDKDTLYVSGRDLSVLKSTDGGATWHPVRKGSYGERNVSKVFFVNSTVGYLLGDGLYELFKTTDGGITWTNLPTELNFQGVTSLYFTSADTGFTSGGGGTAGTMLKTTDGGAHWTNFSLPLSASFNSITFIDRKTGYLIGSSGEILRTQDGALTWQIQNKWPSSLTNSNLSSISFADQNTGYIVGGKEILKTTNGGLKWEVIAQSAFDLRSVSFIDPLHGISVGGDWQHEYSGISMTANGGMNWNEHSSTLTDRYIRKIKFANATTGYAVGGNTNTYGGFILKTTDTGNTWSSINTGLDNYYINDLSLPDENTIYTVGQSGQILKSGDAGATWQMQTTNTTVSLNAVFFLNPQTGYVVGDNQTILKTSNGGATWTKQLSPKTQHLYSVFFKDINTGYIASYDWEVDSCTVLLTTTDGGLNWKSRRIGTLRYPSKITFVNQDTAFIAGDFGAMLKTTDGANHWTPLYFHGNTYYDLFFSSENTGYAVGEDGEISMTENCGKDWTVLNSGTDQDLLSICFTDVNTGFAVGSNGIILKTTNSGSSLKALRQNFYNLCIGNEASIQPNFIGGTKPLTWLWSNDETTPSLSFTASQTTNYKVTVTDAEMDTLQISLRVEVPLLQTPVIRLENNTIISSAGYGNRWFRNDTLIANAYTDQLVPTSEGDYYCMVYDYSCISEKSNVIHIYPTAADEIPVNDVQVYPNPVSFLLTVDLPHANSECLLILTNVHGKEMIRQKASEQKIQLNMSPLPQGIYFLQVLSNDQMITKKIHKN